MPALFPPSPSGLPMSLDASKAERTGLQPPSTQPPTIDSAALLGDGREVLIRHGSERYRLRHTRNGKLILTK